MISNHTPRANIPAAALNWARAGYQVVPVRENKSTLSGWTVLPVPTVEEVAAYYSESQYSRLGVAVGSEDRSGKNLTLTEIDVHELHDAGKHDEAGRRAAEIFSQLNAAIRAVDAELYGAWTATHEGYLETTGRRGIHVLSTADVIVPGNLRVTFPDGSAIENHHGYCAVAPTPGYQAAGSPEMIRPLTAAQVKLIFEIAATLPGAVKSEAKAQPQARAVKQPDYDPSVPSLTAFYADRGYKSSRPWSEILEDWSEASDGLTSADYKTPDIGNYTCWVRPGSTSAKGTAGFDRSAVTYDDPNGGGYMNMFSSGMDELEPGTYTKPAVWKALHADEDGDNTKLYWADLRDGHREDEYVDAVAAAIEEAYADEEDEEDGTEVVPFAPAPTPLQASMLAVPVVAAVVSEPPYEHPYDCDEEEPLTTNPVAAFVPAGKSDAVLSKGVAIRSRAQGGMVYGRDTGVYYIAEGMTYAEYPVDLAIKSAADAMPSIPAFKAGLAKQGTTDRQSDIDADEDKVKIYTLAKARMSSADGRGAVKRLLGAEMWNDGVDVKHLDSEAHILWASGIAWDLRTGQPAAAGTYNPVHLKTCPVAPAEGPTPVFDMLTSAMWPDYETRAYALREIAGRLLWGEQAKENVVIDSPSNGLKSTFTYQLAKILGSYAVVLSPSVLLGEDNSSDAADAKRGLVAARYVLLDEPPRPNRQNVSAFKDIFSGSGTMTVGGKWQKSLTFVKRFNAIVCENADNRLRFDDTAVANRVLFIPCDASTPATLAAFNVVDAGLMTAEFPAILHKLIAECAAYRRGERLVEPHAVAMERERVYGEASTFTEWVLDHYELPDPVQPKLHWSVSATDLMEGYNRFAANCRLPAVSLSNVREALTKAGISVERTRYSRTATPLNPKAAAQWR